MIKEIVGAIHGQELFPVLVIMASSLVHWVTHSDGLFLVYTCRGANNNHLARHRAPLFIAQVDPQSLRVIRDTERILVPERGARLGNFRITDVSLNKTWVTVAEWMQPRGVEKYGSDGSLFVARIYWDRPNRLFRPKIINKNISTMKNTILIILVLSISLLGCTNSHIEKPADKEITVYVSPFKPVIYSDDHTSEGFLVPIDDGRILHIFRFDPGTEGDHVGNDGYIAKIPYDPGKDEWGEVETVYNSHQFDDRNIHGGITKEGRIVIFFRRYNGRDTEGRYFIYSDDNGQTWSDLQVNKFMSDPEVIDMRGNMSTGRMFYNPDIGKYIMLGFLYSWDQDRRYTENRRYIAYSEDGSSWEEYNFVINDLDYRLNEIAGAWCGDNRIIALQRDDDRKHGHPLVQVESYDNGLTWTKPVQTNIPPKKHWGAGPEMIYDMKRDLLIALSSDRYSRPNEQNSLFIYTARPEDVIGNPQGWRLQHELRRPWAALDFDGDRPLTRVFYGYPSIAPINDKEYLVIFTENATIDGREQADLYYFRMIIN